MGNRTAKFVSALVASLVAGAPLAAVSQSAPSAPAAAAAAPADDCLASPKGAAPQGQHWYYRLERGTKRQCWYLREEGAKPAQSATAAPASDSPAPRSVKDARAELTTPQAAPVQDTTASSPAQTAPQTVAPQAATQQPNAASDGGAQQPAISARWPDASSTAQIAAPQTAPAPKIADARPASKSAAAPAPAPMTSATAEVPADKPTGSLQTLLLVVGGALALAGITGSLIYRLAGARVRVRTNDGARRRVNWDNWEPPADNSRAPWADAAGGLAPHARRPQPVDFSFAEAQAAVNKLDTNHSLAIETFADEIKVIEAASVQPDEAAREPEASEFEDDAEDDAIEPRVEAIHASAEAADADSDDDAIDIAALTQILERLAKEGPRLTPSPTSSPSLSPGQPIAAAGSADFSQSRQARSGVRA